jgi:nitroreductase
MDQQVVRDIVEQAARAPSIHNTQPWRFVASGDTLQLWTDESRGLTVIDPTGRARHLSCGAALLHARVAAAAARLQPSVALLPDPAQPQHLADLRLAEGGAEAVDSDLAGAIGTRRTVRSAFTSEAVPDEVLAELRRAAEHEGCWARVIDSSDDAAAVAVLLSRADEIEAADPAYQDELRRWTMAGEGATEGVPSSAVPDVAPSRRGSNYRLRDFVPDREPGAFADEDADPPPVERPTVMVLGTSDDDVAAWLVAGQAVGRVLLTAAARGVAASPMTQPLEIPDMRRRLALELGVVGHPQMILRLGYAADGSSAATPRRPVEDILTDGDG